ncbi:MAG: phosphatidylserine decarboxylase [Pseudomonadota bacterium]|nr:phosphatidylserine decarboxylase [Pseudomonadota bacterium]
MTALDTVIVPIHRAGWPFMLAFLLASLLLWILWVPLGAIGLILTAWCVYFFRDPDRVTPAQPGLVVSPADGRVMAIVQAVPPADLEMGDKPLTRISIFLNVFNVHVNRIPVDGTIDHIRYHEGKFLNASLDKASDDNERNSIRIRTPDGRHVGVVQIAGLVARRILCDAQNGQAVQAGQRYGIIRFGSRADIWLPEGVAPLVIAGQTALGGETVLADLAHIHEPRTGTTH